MKESAETMLRRCALVMGQTNGAIEKRPHEHRGFFVFVPLMLVEFRKLFDREEIVRVRRKHALPEPRGFFPAMGPRVDEGKGPPCGRCHVRMMGQGQCFEDARTPLAFAALVDQSRQSKEVSVMAVSFLLAIFYEARQVSEERCQ